MLIFCVLIFSLHSHAPLSSSCYCGIMVTPYILSRADTSSQSNTSCVTNRFLIVNSLIHLTNHIHTYSKPLSFLLPLIQRHHACSQECDSQTAKRSFTTLATCQRLRKSTPTNHTVCFTHRWRLWQLCCQGIHGKYAWLLWAVVATAWQLRSFFWTFDKTTDGLLLF